MDAHGNPVPGASVRLEKDFGEEMFGVVRWERLWSNTATADMEGAFSIQDPGRRGRYRIVVDDRESVVTHREVVRAESGIEVKLRPGWTVTGEVTWDESLEVDGLLVEIEPQDQSKWWDFRFSDPVNRESSSFEIRQVEGGAYTLAIFPPSSGHPVHQEDLELVAGVGRMDVGLIDLRGKLKTATLRLTVEDEDEFLFATAIDRDGVQMGSEEDGKISVVFAEDFLDLVVIARGYRNTEVENLQGDREILLQRGIPIELEFDVVVGIPSKFDSEIILVRRPDPGDEEQSGAYWNRQTLSSTWSNRFFMPDPGLYKVMIGLNDYSGATAENGHAYGFTYFSTEADAPTITVLEQEETQYFHVPVDQKAARDAVIRLQHMDWPGRR